MDDGILRQGDVALVPVDYIPRSARRRYRSDQRIKGKGIILAEGEATGHHHAIKDRSAKELIHGTDRYLKVGRNGATLTHQEHDPISVPQGDYRIVRAREYVAPSPRAAAPVTRYVYD